MGFDDFDYFSMPGLGMMTPSYGVSIPPSMAFPNFGMQSMNWFAPTTATGTDSYSKYLEEQKNASIKKHQQEVEDNDKEMKKLEDEKAAKKAELDKSEDKKLTFGEGAGHVAKGLLKSVTSMFTDDKGDFSLSKTLTTVAIGVVAVAADAATGGALTPALLALGTIAGAGQVIKGAQDIDNAKTAEDKGKALEELGEGAGTIGLSIAGIKAAKAAKVAKAGAEAAEATEGIEGATETVKTGTRVAEEVATKKPGFFKRIASWGKDIFKGKKDKVASVPDAEPVVAKVEPKAEVKVTAPKAEILSGDQQELQALKTELNSLKLGTKEYKALQAEINRIDSNIRLVNHKQELAAMKSEVDSKGTWSKDYQQSKAEVEKLEAEIAKEEKILGTSKSRRESLQPAKLNPSTETPEVETVQPVSAAAQQKTPKSVPLPELSTAPRAKAKFGNILSTGLSQAGKDIKAAPFTSLTKDVAIIGTTSAPVSYIGQDTANDARKAKQDSDIEERKADIASFEEKQTALKKQQLATLKTLADELNIKVEKDDTIETLKHKIDEATKATKQAA